MIKMAQVLPLPWLKSLASTCTSLGLLLHCDGDEPDDEDEEGNEDKDGVEDDEDERGQAQRQIC